MDGGEERIIDVNGIRELESEYRERERERERERKSGRGFKVWEWYMRARCIKDENARVQMEHALDIPEPLVGISLAYIPRRDRVYVNTPEESSM